MNKWHVSEYERLKFLSSIFAFDKDLREGTWINWNCFDCWKLSKILSGQLEL